MSPSIIATRAPAWLSAIARFTETVVLPTPPLPAPTAITFFTPGTGCLVKSDSAPPGGPARSSSRRRDDTPASLADRVARPGRASDPCTRTMPASVSSIVNDTRPPSIRRSLTNFSETMSRVEVGIAHGAQRVEHGCFGDSHQFTSFLFRMSQSLKAFRRHVADDRQLEFFALVRLEHQHQPDDRRARDDDKHHEDEAEDRHRIEQHAEQR